MASKPIVLELDRLMTTAGKTIVLDNIIPAVDSQPGEVLTWVAGNFVQSTDFALDSDLSAAVTGLQGGASTSFDTLGKTESAININSNDITTLQTDLATRAPLPAASTPAGEVLIWDGANFQNDNTFALTSYVDSEISDLRTDIIGGASGAYDTLLEIQNELQSNDADISGILTTMATKAPIPSVDTGATEVLAWRSGVWVNDTTFAQTSYVNSEISNLVGAASASFDDLGKIEGVIGSLDSAYKMADSTIQSSLTNETSLRVSGDNGLQIQVDTKAPKPPNGIAAGEFLRWDELNEVFTFATPATGSSGTTIPTPAATTDTTTAGNTEVLIWDNTAGDLKNVATPFVEKPTISAAGEYLSWNGSALVNSTPAGGGATPPTQGSANTFLYHDGTNWQYGTPSLASGAGSTVTGGVVQAVNNTMTGGEALSTSGYSSKGYASITTQLLNSMILFMTSGTPQVNGEAHMSLHWRYRDNPTDPWSTYQDTGKIMMRIAESFSLSEPREGAIAIHAPMRPAGAEVEYRVHFHVVAGTIYYPDNSVVNQLTNMTLMEVAL
jgi:hypothetical protein